MKFANSPLLSQRLPSWRSRLLLLCILAGFAVLAGWSIYLQGFNSAFLQEKGAQRYSRVIELPATRGRILDRNGQVLAVSTPVKSIWAIPEDAKLQPAQVNQLAKLLEMEPREVDRKLADSHDFVYLKRQIPPDVAARILALDLPGIHDQTEYRRYYPTGDVTAHILGFTGAGDVGLEGVELAYQSVLAGKSGSRRVIKDRRGDVVEDVDSIRPPRDGKDVVLALDDRIQYLAYANLRRAVIDNKAKAGSIVVLDARTGEVLALANMPTYNPNNRTRLTGAQLRNRALTDTFEPGSTMKPFTIALALDKGKFRFDSRIQTAPGWLTIGTATIHDSEPHGILTVAQVIQKSSNIGAAKIALTLPPEEMWHNFERLGFGHPLNLGFPGEVGGRVRPYQHWRPIEQATMAYGNGISVTLMQLAHAYLVFARNGDLIPLSLTKLDSPPLYGKQIFTEQTAHEVRAMLEMVEEPGGTAPKARVAGYLVAGKTGTAHKVEGGIYVNRYVASYVGFAPATDPRLVIAVMINEPSAGSYYGGDVAAPVFAKVMAGSLRDLGVAPDEPPQSLQALGQNAPAVKEGT